MFIVSGRDIQSTTIQPVEESHEETSCRPIELHFIIITVNKNEVSDFIHPSNPQAKQDANKEMETA